MHKVSYVAVLAMSGALMLPVTAQAAPPIDVAAGSPPSVTLSVAPFVKKATINVKLPTDPGSTSIVGYYLSESPATPALSAPGWKQAKPSTFTLSAGEGSKDIYAWVKGANGSLSARSHDVTLLDMTAPTVAMLVADTTPKRSVTISLSGDDSIGSPDDPAGITAWAVVEGTALPGTSDPAWVAAAPTSFKVSAGNGSKTITAFSRDAAGNVSDPDTHTVALVVPAPTVGITIPVYTNKLTTSVSLTRTDPGTTGIAGFFVSENGATPAANASGWKIQPTSIVLSAGEGSKTVYAWVKDNNGTVSARGQAQTTLDQTSPTVNLVAPDTSTTRSVSITVTGADSSTGVGRYAVVAGTTAPTAADTAWKSVPVTTFSLWLGNGNKTISAFTRDGAGNVSLASSHIIALVLAAPTVTVSLPAYTNKFTTTVTINTTDPGGTGVTQFWVSESPTVPTAGQVVWVNKPSSFTFSAGQGSKTLHVWAKDANGSVSNGASASTFVDTNAPTASLTAPSSSTSRTITVAVDGTDAGSGITAWAVVSGTTISSLADPAWKASPPTSFSLSAGNGSKTISAFTHDAAGNISAAATRTVDLAIPAPILSALTVPAAVNTVNVPVAFTRSDPGGTGIAGYIVSESGTTPLANDSRWRIAPTSFAMSSGDGIKNLHAWVKDNNGTVSAPTTASTRLDTVLPVTLFSAPVASSVNVINITVSATDTGGSGVTAYAFVVGTTVPGPADPLWKASPPTTWDLGSTIGAHVLTAFSRDLAGNVAVANTRTVILDKTAPVVTFTTVPASNASVIPVTVNGSDTSGSGVTAYALVFGTTAPVANDPAWNASAPSSFDLGSTQGNKVVTAFSRDAAGNVSAGVTQNVYYDTTAPLATFTTNANSRFTVINVSVGGSDSGSGVSAYALVAGTVAPSPGPAWTASAPTTFDLVSGEGGHLLTAFTRDLAGNVSTGIQHTVTLDTIVPTVTFAALPALTSSSVITVTVNGSDIGTGVSRYALVFGTTAPGFGSSSWKASAPTTLDLQGNQGSNTITAFTRDVAGNVSVGVTRTITLDSVAPSASFTAPAVTTVGVISVTAGGSDSGSGINGYAVVVGTTAPLAGSGVWGSAPTSIDIGTAQGSTTLTAFTRDVAGNVSSGVTRVVVYDTVAPTVSFPQPTTPISMNLIPLLVSATDSGSGVTAYAVVIGTTAPDSGSAVWTATPLATMDTGLVDGDYDITAFARDAAGNVSAGVTRSVTVSHDT